MREERRIIGPEEVEERVLPLLEAGTLVPLRVTGTSMAPFLRDRRDMVYLRSPALLPYREGDILFFRRRAGSWVLHRLWQAEGERLVMNGDAQTWFETAVPGQVAGVVEQIGRKGGRPAPARRWDRELARRLWRALFPLRPWLLRQMGRCGKLLRLLSGGERKR